MTQTGVGTGTIGSTAFTNAAFTITEQADTASRQSFIGVFWIDNISAAISIAGVGDFSFISATRCFVSVGADEVGFSRAGFNGLDLLEGPTNFAFVSWDMLGSIGPITGVGKLMQWTSSPGSPAPPVITTGGTLIFNNANGMNTTFQATVTSAPEPGSAALLGLGTLLLAARRRRRA